MVSSITSLLSSLTQSLSSQSTSSSSSNSGREDMDAKLEALGIPSDIISQGPDAVKEYADENGITLPPPPQPPEGGLFERGKGGPDGEPPAEFKAKLEELGVPSDIISQGREAVMEYAKENDIEIPKPPSPQNAGNSLDVDA